jgi:hypothetical protein
VEGDCNGRRGGGQSRGKKGGGGGGQVRGKGKRGGHLGLWEKETTPQMTSDFASNGPQPISLIHAPKINFWSTFF